MAQDPCEWCDGDGNCPECSESGGDEDCEVCGGEGFCPHCFGNNDDDKAAESG